MSKDILLDVKGLTKFFHTPRGVLHAVDDVSFQIERGKTLGLVGESGCGKSTCGRSILRLIEPTSGEVDFEGRDIAKLSGNEMRKLRKEMQIIFQDPFSSINPRKTIAQTIAQPLMLHKICSKSEVSDRVLEIMDTVGLAPRLMNTYPHELDGGRRQRIGIARALAMDPKFIVCDEPVSALDVSIQAQILNLMKERQEKNGLTFLFITHDLSVVNHFSDDIAVMYLGRLIEKAPADELFANPTHPYTKALLLQSPFQISTIKGSVSCSRVKYLPPLIRQRPAALQIDATLPVSVASMRSLCFTTSMRITLLPAFLPKSKCLIV